MFPGNGITAWIGCAVDTAWSRQQAGLAVVVVVAFRFCFRFAKNAPFARWFFGGSCTSDSGWISASGRWWLLHHCCCLVLGRGD